MFWGRLCYFRSFLIMQVQCVICPCTGSFEVTRDRQQLYVNDFRLDREYEGCRTLSIRLETHMLICNINFLGHHVTLTRGKILHLNFQNHCVAVSMHLTIQKRWYLICQNKNYHSPSFKRACEEIMNYMFSFFPTLLARRKSWDSFKKSL